MVAALVFPVQLKMPFLACFVIIRLFHTLKRPIDYVLNSFKRNFHTLLRTVSKSTMMLGTSVRNYIPVLKVSNHLVQLQVKFGLSMLLHGT